MLTLRGSALQKKRDFFVKIFQKMLKNGFFDCFFKTLVDLKKKKVVKILEYFLKIRPPEYLCLVWFFIQSVFDFLISRFCRNFLLLFDKNCGLKLKFETIFHRRYFFLNMGVRKMLISQFGTINAQFIVP